MHDYTVQWPACTYSPFYLLSDCGSSPWAYTLFIVWNILSMCKYHICSRCKVCAC